MSPIRPENRARYPKNWAEIRAKILGRSRHKCEMCGVANGTFRINAEGRRVHIVLTIAHLDHEPDSHRLTRIEASMKAIKDRVYNGSFVRRSECISGRPQASPEKGEP